MKNKIILTIGAMSAAAILGLGFAQSVTVSAGPDLSQEDVKDKVSKQYPGKITELELDEEGNTPIYEVEIEIDGKEYELEVDGNSGEILKLDEKLVQKNKNTKLSVDRFTQAKDLKITEKNDAKKITTNTTSVPAPKQEEKSKLDKPKTETPKLEQKEVEQKIATEKKQPTPEKPKQEEKAAEQAPKKKENKSDKKAIITRDKAIQIALSQFSGKVDDVELDDDDGRLIYEIEIESERGEAEIEIDAYTGNILIVDIDLDDD